MLRSARFLRIFNIVLLMLSVPIIASADPSANWMWIWAADGAHPPETVFFRSSFMLPKGFDSAQLLVTADDNYTLSMNSFKKTVASGTDWSTLEEINVVRYLRAGRNILAFECRNGAGPGGLLFKLSVHFTSGKSLLFFSNSNVKARRRVPPIWKATTLDDSKWPQALEISAANQGVWGTLRAAPHPDPSRIIRLWDIHAGLSQGEDPYMRTPKIGDRMILSSSSTGVSDMQMLAGAGFTLFQTDSDHLSTEETAPNVWNFKEADSASSTVRGLGLDWSYAPHEAFPPPWYRKQVPFTRIECLEHHQPVDAFSPWDPAWASFIDHGYEALSTNFSNKPSAHSAVPSALYVGIHGDYGDAGLLMGARVTVPGQKEDWLNRFGNLHNHLGWWCADPIALQDFRSSSLQKYGSLLDLNRAWKETFKKPDEIQFPSKPRGDARREWLDFVDWYQQGVSHAVDLNVGSARKYFPNTLLQIPAGFSDEDPRGGNDNSLIAKLAVKHHAEIRSTHGAFNQFADNAATMLGRLGSACRFYGVPFWTEPPGPLTQDQEVQRIFEDVSQGAKGHFDWAGNAVTAREAYYRYGKFLKVEKPVVDVAMFYPAQAQKLRPDQGYAPLFAKACSYLRDVANYDIVDDRMVLDGCLARYRVLALWEGTQADQAVLDKLKAWVNDGGVLLAYDFGKVTNFEGDTSWFTELFGYVQQIAPAKVTEKYVGSIPTQYHVPVVDPMSADYLGGDWYPPVARNGVAFRPIGKRATVILPCSPEKQYVLIIRANISAPIESSRTRVLINGHDVGRIDSAGDVTYRFPLTEEILEGRVLTTLVLSYETDSTSSKSAVKNVSKWEGVEINSVGLVESAATEDTLAGLPSGVFRRELDLGLLSKKWAQRYGKGLTIYFPANRQLLKGYIEVLRRVIYHLSMIEPGRRDAMPIDDAFDGVYATLFTDKILYYNPKDTAVTKIITVPAEVFEQWRGEVAIPSDTTWKLTIEPHGIGAVNFTRPPQELLFECEKFTDVGLLKPSISTDCSPGKGVSCVRLLRGAAIATRFTVEIPGRYNLFTRCLHNSKLETVDVFLDGQPIQAVNTVNGQTILAGQVMLTSGTHTLTIRSRPGHDVRADYVLLTNDASISGYGFAMRTATVE